MAKIATKTRVTKKQVVAHRSKAVRDTSPNWEGCESWTTDQFYSHFRRSMDWYRLECELKTFKPSVLS